MPTSRPSAESNIPYYSRFGFELTDEIGLHDSPPLWLMWRQAADAGDRERLVGLTGH